MASCSSLDNNQEGIDKVEFLTEAYGVAEDDRALWAKYYAITQKDGEDLSAFIHRLQIALGPLLHRKFVLASQMDEYLHKQYLRGSSPNHPIANMIRENLTRGSPPNFTGLLQQVKEHKAHLLLHSPQKSKASSNPKSKGSSEKKEETPIKTVSDRPKYPGRASPPYNHRTPSRDLACYKCGRKGHLSYDSHMGERRDRSPSPKKFPPSSMVCGVYTADGSVSESPEQQELLSTIDPAKSTAGDDNPTPDRNT
ncbi:uncharacterized protein LOC142490155 [Ascaphus truei]|uniref:uncharacterized protein LOC142490155 n=1 Tax=Ascaphus truei TaxID=8439 RepID=UPI003F59F0F2